MLGFLRRLFGKHRQRLAVTGRWYTMSLIETNSKAGKLVVKGW